MKMLETNSQTRPCKNLKHSVQGYSGFSRDGLSMSVSKVSEKRLRQILNVSYLSFPQLPPSKKCGPPRWSAWRGVRIIGVPPFCSCPKHHTAARTAPLQGRQENDS